MVDDRTENTSVSFVLTWGAIARFSQFVTSQKPAWQRHFLTIVFIVLPAAILIVGIGLAYALVTSHVHLTPFLKFVFRAVRHIIVPCTVLPGEGLAIIYLIHTSRRSKKPVSQDLRAITLERHGLLYSTDKGTLRIPWMLFKDVQAVNSDIFMVLATQGGIVIPEEAFVGQVKAEGFAELIQELRTATQNQFAGGASRNTVSFVPDFLERARLSTFAERAAFDGRRGTMAFWKAIVLISLIYGISPLFGATGSLVDVVHISTLLLFAAQTWLFHREVKHKGPSSSHRSVVEPTQVSFSPEAITESTPLGIQTLHWSDVKILSDELVIVFAAPGKDPILVPRRAFASPEAADRFLALAEDYRNGRTPEPEPTVWPPPPSGESGAGTWEAERSASRAI